MHWSLYLKGHIVFVPTTGKLDQPVYREMEPVEVVPLSNSDGVRRALLSAIARGNPPAPRYEPGTNPLPAVLKYAGVKSWSAFARGTSTWGIEENQGVYHIEGYRRDQKGYWEPDPDQKITFPPQTTVDTVVERMVSVLEEAVRK